MHILQTYAYLTGGTCNITCLCKQDVSLCKQQLGLCYDIYDLCGLKCNLNNLSTCSTKCIYNQQCTLPGNLHSWQGTSHFSIITGIDTGLASIANTYNYMLTAIYVFGRYLNTWQWRLIHATLNAYTNCNVYFQAWNTWQWTSFCNFVTGQDTTLEPTCIPYGIWT